MSWRAWLIGVIAAWAGGAVAGDSAVVFSEVKYSAGGAGESPWIELHCLNGVDVDLSGYSIEGGAVSYRFPAGTVVAGRGHVVVAQAPGAANLSDVAALGPWTGALRSAGTLRLLNAAGRLMDELEYEAGGDWPVAASEAGATLARRNDDSAAAGADQWTWSSGGSPGRRNFSAPGERLATTAAADWNSPWRYFAAASPARWTEPDFDDSAWAEGPGLFTAGNPDISGFARLLGYWPVNETSGASVNNVVADAPDGVVQGSVTFRYSGTRGGQVLHFTGDGYVNAGEGFLPRLTAAQDFTWAAWVNSTQTGTMNIILGNRYNAAGQNSSPLEFVKLTPSVFEYFLGGEQRGITAPTLATNSWIHHAAVKKGNQLTYYRNGAVVGTSTVDGDQAARQPFYFGGDGHGGNWTGDIDDAAVWGSALSAADIQKLAGNQATPPQVGVGAGTQLAPGSTAFYFRTAFDFHGDPARTRLKLKLLIDDGAIVYLNGRRLYAENMPEGAIVHGTLASSAVPSPAPTDLLDLPGAGLVQGRNVLAVEVHQAQAIGDPDMAFGMQLAAEEALPLPPDESPTLVFNEISASGAGFRLELANVGGEPVDLSGYRVRSSTGATYALSEQALAPGGFLVIDAAMLGFTPAKDDRLFLIAASGAILDGRAVTNKLRGRGSDGAWIFPTAESFGGANVFAISTAVVINEIMYKQRPVSPSPFVESDEEWIELHNRSAAAADLSAWKLADGIGFTFPAGTVLPAGAYLVVAKNAGALATKWPAVASRILGNYSGSLSGKGERVTLKDAEGNPVDTVEYSDGGRWPAEADGGGSSLELRDPRADNSAPEAWAASDESARGVWQTFSWSGVASNANNDPTRWNEFILGLLDAGTFLVDDVSVTPGGGGNLIQNGGFESGDASTWRLLGTHRHAAVVDDPAGSGKVLRVEASGPTEHMHNHAETTLKSGGSYHTISGSSSYTISFRTRWVSGSNQLNARLYFNRLARTVSLPISAGGGTPGALNSCAVTNAGPTFSGLMHSPAVPKAGSPVEVRLAAADPDGVAGVTLHYAVNEGAWQTVPMTLAADHYIAEIPAQSGGSKAQFYVSMTDGAGAESMTPAAGPASRAIVPWDDGQARLETNGVFPTNLRIAMLDSDAAFLHEPTNVMSNDRMEATVIADENEVYYGCGVRLKGSERGRDQPGRVGFSVRFPSDNKLFGVHKTVSMDRMSIGGGSANLEILVKRGILGAGGIPGSEDDLCRVIAPQSRHTSAAVLTKSRFDGDYLDGQYESGADGMAFKYEYVYYPTSTTGGVEGLKYPEPDDVVGVGVGSLGADKERYRWYWLVENNEDIDDYGGLIDFLGVIGRNPSWPANAGDFADLEASMDVEQWLRTFAILVLFGVGDNYGTGAGHNAILYERPEDGRFLFFPHDMDYVFSQPVNASIAPNGELQKLIRKPANRRSYYHALYEICQTTFNSAWLLPWAQHYGKFSGTNMAANMGYVEQRRAYVLSAIAGSTSEVAFAITTPDGTAVEGASAVIEGSGWIDIHELRLAGGPALPVTWTGLNTWRTTAPVHSGPNALTVQAFDAQGALVGQDTVTLNGTITVVPAVAGKLVVGELMYHPGDPSAAERAAGFTNAEDFEFVELQNISGETLDLTGARFTTGITFAFPAGMQLAPGARTVLAGNRAAFAARYGSEAALVDGQYGPGSRFDNAGELVVLADAQGTDVVRFNYSDDPPWPVEADGDGYSLVLTRPATGPNPATWTSWRLSTRPGGNPGATDATAFIGDPNADDDGNGVSNFLQYASAGATPYAAPTLTLTGGRWTLRYRRNLAAEDATFRAEASEDLAKWTDLPGGVVVSEKPNGDGTATVTCTDVLPGADKEFFRVSAFSSP